MLIDKALKLKRGDVVHCPADRGESAFSGKVTHNINNDIAINESLNGIKYIWVEIQGILHKSVWPSNRLG